MPNSAFLPSVPISTTHHNLRISSSVCRNTVSIPCRTRKIRLMKMCEEPISAAERTRRALKESEPLVKFRKETEYLDQDTSFRYTKGVKEGGIDIWLITGILTFLVPLIGFALGVATGNIDINPR